ncbi:MAG: glycosyltransferase family 2 protein, partial [Limisphaerales bacterium]
MKAAALIPCFNEGQTIGIVVSQMRRHVERVIVVDDGSTDQTNAEASAAGAVVLRHGRNFGKGAALKTGLSYLHRLGYEWAFTLDGDGQHDPADAPALRQCARETPALLVVGNRMGHAGAMPGIRRRVNAWMSDKLSQYAGCTLPDTQCG